MSNIINADQYIRVGDKLYKVNGGGAKSWNDLKDKPFGDESVTIEWDGNTEGRVTVDIDGLTCVKVSDLTLEPEDLIGGSITLSTPHGEENAIITSDFVMDARPDINAVMVLDYIIIAYSDNVMGFAEKGIYFAVSEYGYASKLEVNSIKKIDSKFMPNEEFIIEVDENSNATVDGKPLEIGQLGAAIQRGCRLVCRVRELASGADYYIVSESLSNSQISVANISSVSFIFPLFDMDVTGKLLWININDNGSIIHVNQRNLTVPTSPAVVNSVLVSTDFGGITCDQYKIPIRNVNGNLYYLSVSDGGELQVTAAN